MEQKVVHGGIGVQGGGVASSALSGGCFLEEGTSKLSHQGGVGGRALGQEAWCAQRPSAENG